MDYEQKYKKALETARKINSGEGVAAPPDWTICEVIFPELKESVDEKIRKTLIKFHKSTIDIDGIKGDDIVDWLEKQGEKDKLIEDKDKLIKELGEYKVKYTQEVISQQLENQIGQKPTDKAKPKFKVGDWVVDNCNNLWKIVGIMNGFYILEDGDEGGSRPTIEWVDKTFHFWAIQDAKDGDVLVANIHHWEIGGNVENFPVRVPTIFIYQKVKTDKENIHVYVSLYNGNFLVL